MNSWTNEELKNDSATRAGIYLRVSTLDQKDGHGIELQKTKCKAMATVKGWTITKTYKDEGISGTIKETERPGFSQLIQDATDRVIDAVIVYALDRLGRRTQIVLRTIENLADMGIKVVSCRENLDTSSAAGTFMVTIFAALSQLERDTIVERMKAGTEERRKVDGDIGGHMPMGYKREHGTVMIEEKRASVVRTIFHRRYIDSRYMYEIAEELNERGAPLATKRGKVWKNSVVQKILDNEAKYLGGYRNKSKFRWPRILPKDFAEQEAKAKEKRKTIEQLDLPLPLNQPKVKKARNFKGDRNIKRSKRALEQLKALKKGEVLPKYSEVKVVQPKVYEEKVNLEVVPKTPSPPRKSSLKIRIPSPEPEVKRDNSSSATAKIRIPSPIPPKRRSKQNITETYIKQNRNVLSPLNLPPSSQDIAPSLNIPSPQRQRRSPPRDIHPTYVSYPRPPPTRRIRSKK